jgi:thioredoxin 1
MATIEITKENFNETVESHDIVLLDFWAEWCGPCKMFGPVYEKVSENHDDVVFGKINTEVEQELAAHFQIRSIPTFMAIRDQITVFAQPGAVPEQFVEEVIGKVKELDMDAVKKEIEEMEKNHEHGHGGCGHDDCGCGH